jgi:putative hydrolase of the HAD superfamily
VIKAVLFDLDGTLLDIDLDAFLHAYFSLLGPVVADLLGDGAGTREALAAVIESTHAMSRPHPGRTNREAFNATFLLLTGFDLGSAEAAARLELFYREQFPGLQSAHGPKPGGYEVVAAARRLGLSTALATNPIFPMAAIEERARWAGLDTAVFDVVTSYESMRACKPSPAYFLQVAESLEVAPSECLMVGDDPTLDLAASAVRMKTYYVGSRTSIGADHAGTLSELAGLLPHLTR